MSDLQGWRQTPHLSGRSACPHDSMSPDVSTLSGMSWKPDYTTKTWDNKGVLAANLLVNVIAVGLIVIGIGLLWVTFSYWKSATPDHAALATLEIMEDRRFSRADDSKRVDMLNKVRPSGEAPKERIEEPPVLRREPRRAKSEHDERSVEDRPQESKPSVPIDPLLSRHSDGGK